MLGLIVTVPITIATEIAAGRKRVEFRKKLPLRSVQKLLVCAAGTGGRITAEAMISAIRTFHPVVAWELYSDVAGVSKARFFDYVGELNTIGCIEIVDAQPVEGVALSQFNILRPPQNFLYVEL